MVLNLPKNGTSAADDVFTARPLLAMQSGVIPTAIPSVRSSVCLSVCPSSVADDVLSLSADDRLINIVSFIMTVRC